MKKMILHTLVRVARAALIALGLTSIGKSLGAEAKLETGTLSNGIRAAVVAFPGSTNVSLFTFLPMGLASDGPGQAQWSHLIEHLVIRSTFPNDLRQANAETMPDNLRLDFYGHTGNWKEGLSHHRRWLEGVPFTQASLAAEKPKIISECDYTAKNFATHKFAMAAWAQGYRHGQTQAELKGNILRADLKDVQRYRDERLVVLEKTTVCLVGGVDARTFFAEAEKQLGGIQPQAKPASIANTHRGNLDLTWDLDARHLVLTWPMPDTTQDDYAALMVTAPWLTMQFFSDEKLKPLVGMVLADTDLSTPEGNFFYISASLRPSATFEGVQKQLRASLGRLTANAGGLNDIPMVSQQLAFSLTQVPDLDVLMSRAPLHVSRAMAEGSLGLRLCLNVHRYGPQREALAKKLLGISPEKVRQATAIFLAQEKGSVTTIRPIAESLKK